MYQGALELECQPIEMCEVQFFYLQANDLVESLHVNTSDLKSSTSQIQEVLMGGAFPSVLEAQIRERLSAPPFDGALVAVRSSGTDEDSSAHSFAGTASVW